MLSSAETDLVHRETALPGLGAVLDPERFLQTLRRAIPAANLAEAHITYTRYKPRSHCRVAYRLGVGSEEVELEAAAYRPEDLMTWRSKPEPSVVTGPLGVGYIVLEKESVLVTMFPNDIRLPALRELVDATERERVLSELLPDRPDLWRSELRCLHYRPERRYVTELRGASGSRAFLKACTRKSYKRSTHNARSFQSRDALRLASVLGCSDERQMFVCEWLAGRPLAGLSFGAVVDDWWAVEATGAGLAELHSQDPGGLGSWTRENESADLLAIAREVGFIFPPLALHAERVGERLAALVASRPAVGRPIHGDFSANQVLVHEGGVAIIDLDWACYGDPADDLGNFIAQAERAALRGSLPASRVEPMRAALLEGYARAARKPPPDRIGLYTAVEVFRRIRFPFRARELDWPLRTEGLLERAETLLKGLN